jgi:TPR repeat protein
MAAEQGYSEAQYDLGSFYATDWLPVYDPLLASQWMKAAAEQGHAEAIEALKFRG